MKAPELTELAIAWLREEYPEAYVTTELSVAEWGGASVDVAAITMSEIVGVEVKGDGDSPTMLDLQGLTYGRVCRRMWLLTSPEGTLGGRCQKKKPKGWGVLEVSDGAVAPRALKSEFSDRVRRSEAREMPHLCSMAMCETLWRDELYKIAKDANLTFAGGSRATVTTLRQAIVSALPVTRIHDMMIERLRVRAGAWAHKTVYPPSIDCNNWCAACRGTGKWRGGGSSLVEDVWCGHCGGKGRK